MEYAPPESSSNIVLVANKQDLDSERQVTLDEAVMFAKRLKLAGVVETSAKYGHIIFKLQ